MAAYQVKRTKEFDAAYAALGNPEPRRDEALRAVEDALSRNPYVCPEVRSNGHGVRVIRADPVRMMPLLVYYQITSDGVVTLVGVRRFGM